MLPNSTPQATREKVIDSLLNSGLWTNRKITKMCVVGVRGYYLNSMGKRGVNDRGIYDDAFFVLSPDTFTSFNGNTDPSRYKARVATLVAPQTIKYKKGLHGYSRKAGPYPAFRQASDVIVKRDGGSGNGRQLLDGTFTDRGTRRFWTNNHKGGYTVTSSAGCLTVPPNQWNAYYSLVCLQMQRFKQRIFKMNLLENK